MRPLWELAKATLTEHQNLLEFNVFLKSNGRKHHHETSINFEVMFLRVTVLMLFFQAQCVEQAWWAWIYLCAKAVLLFQMSIEKRQGLQVLLMLLVFHLLDYVTSLIPFMPILFWYVNIAYFLYGIQEKYLSLNLMMLPIPLLSKSLIITIVALGKTLKHPHHPHIIAYTDLLVLLLTRRIKYAIGFGVVLLIVETIRVMDRRMIYTKKYLLLDDRKYTHLDEIPRIEQYH